MSHFESTPREEGGHHIRISVMTFNAWGKHYWPQRRDSLKSLLSNIIPDIILFQEVTREILLAAQEALPGYRYIYDEKHDTSEISSAPAGWFNESNILYSPDILEAKEYGIFPLDMQAHPHRGLFFGRFSVKQNPNIKILFSTAHLPWTGSIQEVSQSLNPRIELTQSIINYLRHYVEANPQDNLVFCGDLNEDFHPIRILKQSGMRDVFDWLDLPPEVTHPVRPSDKEEENRPNRTLDWITCSFPPHKLCSLTSRHAAAESSSSASEPVSGLTPGRHSRVLAAFVKKVRGGGMGAIPPSDHMPVVAILQLAESSSV